MDAVGSLSGAGPAYVGSRVVGLKIKRFEGKMKLQVLCHFLIIIQFPVFGFEYATLMVGPSVTPHRLNIDGIGYNSQ